MRPALLVFLMLFLLVEAQGIRVLQQQLIASIDNQIFHEENERSLIKESDGVGADVGKAVAALCRDGHCSGIRSRKLENFSTSSTSTNSKSVKNNGGTKMEQTLKHPHLRSHENFRPVESSPVSGHGKVAPQRYPDIIDIAGMDYSPAKRKPPIHN
ncbi:uncharacterized protein LOC122650981 [Telopea speciosissima]|uniref:uncharacterized protein LOC122650981 n=1 Tax=Telopea speciosissima TaxID=54955 RepID=UPI001CC3C745|nr:uncharacterized protein LOC122650981 [Telopea speciosissima]